MGFGIPGIPILGGSQSGGSAAPVITTVATENDIPPSAQGFYFVTASEKGDSQLYLYNGGIRYWQAMVKDS